MIEIENQYCVDEGCVGRRIKKKTISAPNKTSSPNPPKSPATFSASSAEKAGRDLGVGIPYCYISDVVPPYKEGKRGTKGREETTYRVEEFHRLILVYG